MIKDSQGNITELRCTYDPSSKGGTSPDGRKVKGTIHWVSAKHAVKAEVRLFDRLFMEQDPDDVPEGVDWKTGLNPSSLKVITGYLEPSLEEAKPLEKFQFERTGYFSVDYDSKPGKLVFNRTSTLKDTWAKISEQ